jgi:hypothetical protein
MALPWAQEPYSCPFSWVRRRHCPVYHRPRRLAVNLLAAQSAEPVYPVVKNVGR